MGSYRNSITYVTNIIVSYQQHIRYITWIYTVGELLNASLITTTQKSPRMWWSKVHCAFIFNAQAPFLDCLLKMKAL